MTYLSTAQLIAQAEAEIDALSNSQAPGAPVSNAARLLHLLATRLLRCEHQLHMATFHEDMGR